MCWALIFIKWDLNLGKGNQIVLTVQRDTAGGKKRKRCIYCCSSVGKREKMGALDLSWYWIQSEVDLWCLGGSGQKSWCIKNGGKFWSMWVGAVTFATVVPRKSRGLFTDVVLCPCFSPRHFHKTLSTATPSNPPLTDWIMVENPTRLGFFSVPLCLWSNMTQGLDILKTLLRIWLCPKEHVLSFTGERRLWQKASVNDGPYVHSQVLNTCWGKLLTVKAGNQSTAVTAAAVSPLYFCVFLFSQPPLCLHLPYLSPVFSPFCARVHVCAKLTSSITKSTNSYVVPHCTVLHHVCFCVCIGFLQASESEGLLLPW